MSGNLIAKIPEVEMSMMDRYVTSYAASSHASMDRLLRVWDEAKSEYLFKLLGEKFQISKEFEYRKPQGTLIRELNNQFDNFSSYCYRFRKWFDRFLWDHRFDLGSTYYRLQPLMEMNCLIDSKYEGEEFTVNIPGGKTIKIQKGCRPLRMIARVVNAYGGSDLIDGFQTEVSQVLNQKKLKGTMTLSIHPLDYMTMSDNECGWSSCMSWQDEGCYRRGTVEMMNSHNVLVAFLSSDDPMMLRDKMGDRHPWNSKKWRELFIVTPQVITGVKGYPYQNDDLVKSVNSWIKELAETNLGWKYCDSNTPYQHRSNFSYQGTDDKAHDMKLSFETYTMYNDFGSIDRHWCIMGEENEIDSDAIYVNYSGDEICMQCGNFTSDFDGEGALVCMDCDGCYNTCDECGCRMSEDDTFMLDGYYYCESCYNDLCGIDALTGDEHNVNNMMPLQIVPEGTDPSIIDYGTGFRRDVYEPNRYNTAWTNTFKLLSPRSINNTTSTAWGSRTATYYYVYPSDFKYRDDMTELFDMDEELIRRYCGEEDCD